MRSYTTLWKRLSARHARRVALLPVVESAFDPATHTAMPTDYGRSSLLLGGASA
ncbi:MAG: hypothetical protein ACYYK0_02035 [Candidatus Eutrophobiaceae bacterium]